MELGNEKSCMVGDDSNAAGRVDEDDERKRS